MKVSQIKSSDAATGLALKGLSFGLTVWGLRFWDGVRCLGKGTGKSYAFEFHKNVSDYLDI